MAQQLDADYVLMGDYRVEGSKITAHARLMDMEHLHLSPEIVESGPLTSLIAIQTALAWDVLATLNPSDRWAKQILSRKFPAQRLDVLENYVRGITASTEQEKITRFKEVVRLDPANTLAMLQLGKSYLQSARL